MSWMVGAHIGGLSALAGLATLLLKPDGLRQRVLTWNRQRRRHHAADAIDPAHDDHSDELSLPCGWKT